MKREELLGVYNSVTKLTEFVQGVKMSYCLANNMAKMKPEITAIEEAQKPRSNFKEYETKRLKKAQEHAKKNEENEPLKTENGFLYLIEDEEKFKEEIDKLQEEYAEAIKERTEQIEELRDFLNEDIEIEFYKLDEKDLKIDEEKCKKCNINLTELLLPLMGKIL